MRTNKDRALIDNIDSLLNAYVAQAISKAEFNEALLGLLNEHAVSPLQAVRDSLIAASRAEAALLVAQMKLDRATARLSKLLHS